VPDFAAGVGLMNKLIVFLILTIAFPAGCTSVSPLTRAYVRTADCATRDASHKGTLKCPE
jgi:hypothetical protein